VGKRPQNGPTFTKSPKRAQPSAPPLPDRIKGQREQAVLDCADRKLLNTDAAAWMEKRRKARAMRERG
jgi:hypothetical protein